MLAFAGSVLCCQKSADLPVIASRLIDCLIVFKETRIATKDDPYKAEVSFDDGLLILFQLTEQWRDPFFEQLPRSFLFAVDTQELCALHQQPHRPLEIACLLFRSRSFCEERDGTRPPAASSHRSEERRVGKECR